ncbi:hypothetical protein TrLO_g5598 [Triparma laevis f. longispina]|uniref:Mesencephalic astrocyte-derived neurotrophic factor homolog n=1 Tax=Triparma laevis f. longispina TaxID=1714387 RepID=A0A9W7EDF8_9STRA|nr:hypothetical protein TrLO_g5598 [Triparma laevis f. longispina]
MIRSTILLLIFSLLLATSLAGECEVCTKVIDDVRESMGEKKTWKSKPAVEAALDKYCKKKELGVREKKICYYLTPIKRDVAQPFSLGIPSSKVCKKLEKVNPEVCSVRFPVKTGNMEKKDYTKLRVKQLKQILADRGVECKGCAEKAEFVKRVTDTDHMEEL